MSLVQNMKVKFWSFATSNGDGSASVLLFKSFKAASDYATAKCNSDYYETWDESENISSEELEIDENGNILTPDPVWED